MNDFISEDMQLAVKKGAAWLDQHDPEWVQKIHLESLEMNHCGQCILGQWKGDYWDVLAETLDDDTNWDAWAIEHGFDAAGGDWKTSEYQAWLAVEYQSLGSIWTDYINQRNQKEG